jgi:hypothetical protein
VLSGGMANASARFSGGAEIVTGGGADFGA